MIEGELLGERSMVKALELHKTLRGDLALLLRGGKRFSIH